MKQFAHQLATLSLVLFLCIPSIAQVSGNGNVSKETRSHSGFTGIKVGGAFDVYLVQDDKFRVVVEADDNLLDHIVTTVDGNTLVIKTKGNIRKSNAMKAYITLPEMNHMEISGACDVIGKSTFSTDKLKLGMSGASDVKLDINVRELDCGMSGSSDLNISGQASKMNLGVSGSGDIHGDELYGSHGNVAVSGAGTIKVHLSESIKASVSGSGDVYCYGNPEDTQIHTSGSGEVHIDGKSYKGHKSPKPASGKVY